MSILVDIIADINDTISIMTVMNKSISILQFQVDSIEVPSQVWKKGAFDTVTGPAAVLVSVTEGRRLRSESFLNEQWALFLTPYPIPPKYFVPRCHLKSNYPPIVSEIM